MQVASGPKREGSSRGSGARIHANFAELGLSALRRWGTGLDKAADGIKISDCAQRIYQLQRRPLLLPGFSAPRSLALLSSAPLKTGEVAPGVQGTSATAPLADSIGFSQAEGFPALLKLGTNQGVPQSKRPLSDTHIRSSRMSVFKLLSQSSTLMDV